MLASRVPPSVVRPPAVAARRQQRLGADARANAAAPPAALPRIGLADLLPSWLRPEASKPPANPYQRQRDELLSILLAADAEDADDIADDADDASASSSRSALPAPPAMPPRERAARASALVDELLASRLPFDERLLGGGPWVVRFTKGAPQLWKATWQSGRLLAGRRGAGDEASQEFEPATRGAVNRAEYFGGRLYVTATGTYTPLRRDGTDGTDGDGSSGSSSSSSSGNSSGSGSGGAMLMPQPVRADIEAGALFAFGREVALPIRGSGRFEVAYLDADLRVFRSGGSVSVQVRKGYLAEARARRRQQQRRR